MGRRAHEEKGVLTVEDGFSKVRLFGGMFGETVRLLLESGEFRAETFRYSTGVDAVKVSNARGSFTILPFMGQQVWRCDFDGLELAMKSIHDEPEVCRDCFTESYGCFMMHCGLTAMGNPTAADSHVGHAELPIARYRDAWIGIGRDRRGPYIAVGGTFLNRLCFTHSYAFSPVVRLRAGAARLEIEASIRNNKDIPLEYYYLCHLNHRPVDGSKIVESPLSRRPIVNREVPEGYYKPWADATERFLDALERDYRIQRTVGVKGESYRPEIVNCYFHRPGRDGWAFVKQMFPKRVGKAGGVYVRYRPAELPYATRWIARTKDEDAMGMCLPATAEHKGRTFCRAHKQQRILAPGKTVTYHVEAGWQDKAATRAMKKKIDAILR